MRGLRLPLITCGLLVRVIPRIKIELVHGIITCDYGKGPSSIVITVKARCPQINKFPLLLEEQNLLLFIIGEPKKE